MPSRSASLAIFLLAFAMTGGCEKHPTYTPPEGGIWEYYVGSGQKSGRPVAAAVQHNLTVGCLENWQTEELEFVVTSTWDVARESATVRYRLDDGPDQVFSWDPRFGFAGFGSTSDLIHPLWFPQDPVEFARRVASSKLLVLDTTDWYGRKQEITYLVDGLGHYLPGILQRCGIS